MFLYTASISLGEDIIIIDMIKTGWLILKGLVYALYRASVLLGHYLKLFKKSCIVIILKVGKRDLIDVGL